ncbi:NapC/NirT family cytochrome c [bacterium]|nr:NapC/NirT family cytochrome c [bacterium]
MSSDKKSSMFRKVLLVVAILVVIAVVAVAGIEVTCTPWFCNRCHEMNEYFDTWTLCNHGPESTRNMKDCMKCHIKPGFLNFLKAKANGVFSLLFHLAGYHHVEATLPVICLREGCHTMEQLDEFDRTADPAETVKLNHRMHIEINEKIGTRYKCMPCHKNVAHGKQQKFMPDMKDTCFLCHSDTDIRYKNCDSCHPAHPLIKGKVENLYEIHTEYEVKCEECHIDAHKANEISCLNCHDESYTEGVEFKIVGID